MFNRRREQRLTTESDPEENQDPPDTGAQANGFHSRSWSPSPGENGEDMPIPTRRSIVDSGIRDPVRPVPLEERGLPDIYNQLDHMWDELSYQTRFMPAMNCRLDTRLELMIRALENKVKKIDKNRVSVKLGKKEITFRLGLILTIVGALIKIYDIPLMSVIFWM